MKRSILISTIVLLSFNLLAQNTIENVLTEVEKNNTSLSALRKSIDAEKIGNKTGLTLQNPEVEFNYLFGTPSVIGNRADFSIKQSFEYPTVYSYRRLISDLKNEQAELEYKKKRIEVIYQTRIVCVQLSYYNALKVELDKRQTEALKVSDAYKAKFSAGDAGILDYNKSQINLLNVTKELENLEIERNTLLSELATLNGGNLINFTDSVFSMQKIPADFEQWFAQLEINNPILQWIKQEITITSKEVKLNEAMNLPKFNGGLMSEKVTGQHFLGLTFGVTIPLWENKNRVNYTKARTIAAQSIETDARFQFYNKMKEQYKKIIALQKNVKDYSSKLASYNNSELLEKAFNKGEISLTEYMYELSLYYENAFRLLEMEMQLHLNIAEMMKF
jgi:outer membrane protein TolC